MMLCYFSQLAGAASILGHLEPHDIAATQLSRWDEVQGRAGAGGGVLAWGYVWLYISVSLKMCIKQPGGTWRKVVCRRSRRKYNESSLVHESGTLSPWRWRSERCSKEIMHRPTVYIPTDSCGLGLGLKLVKSPSFFLLSPVCLFNLIFSFLCFAKRWFKTFKSLCDPVQYYTLTLYNHSFGEKKTMTGCIVRSRLGEANFPASVVVALR